MPRKTLKIVQMYVVFHAEFKYVPKSSRREWSTMRFFKKPFQEALNQYLLERFFVTNCIVDHSRRLLLGTDLDLA